MPFCSAVLGLAFDDWDLDFYTKLFQDKVKRNPTSVECFDLAQSNRWDLKASFLACLFWGKSWAVVIARSSALCKNFNVVHYSKIIKVINTKLGIFVHHDKLQGKGHNSESYIFGVMPHFQLKILSKMMALTNEHRFCRWCCFVFNWRYWTYLN